MTTIEVVLIGVVAFLVGVVAGMILAAYIGGKF